jgi:hypothetical protein
MEDAMSMFNIRRESRRPLTVYFAGQCWNNKDLIGNIYLSECIHRRSGFRYRCVLPQNLHKTNQTDLQIKNNTLGMIRDCDGVFLNFDGTDIDQKTVVEFMAAKFVNKPAVIVRTDFRDGGDKPGYEPWNLMLHCWPRTEVVKLPKSVIQDYQERSQEYGETKGNITQLVATELSEILADWVVKKLDIVFRDYRREENDVRGELFEGINLKANYDAFTGIHRKPTMD